MDHWKRACVMSGVTLFVVGGIVGGPVVADTIAVQPGGWAVAQDETAAANAEAEHREEVDDAHIPWAGERSALPRRERATWTHGPYTSVQVNMDVFGNNIPGDAANEPSLAIDPTDPNRIVIGWRQFDTVASNFRQAGWAYSHDGGHTWTFPGVLRPGEFSSDPVLDVDIEGNFYYYSLQPDRGPAPWACYLYRSFDGGVTWPQDVYARGGDKAWMTIDRTGGVGSGNVYFTWNSAFSCCGNTDFARSTDSGLSTPWPQKMPAYIHWGTMSVGPDGELYIAGESFYVAKSTNAQFSAETPEFDFVTYVDLGGDIRFSTGPNPGGLLGQAWIATDHSDGPSRGNVYLLASVDPPGAEPLDVMFSRSEDGGVTWSAPVRVNDDSPSGNSWQWFGTMSVAPNGRIDAIWNDTRADPSTTWSELYYSYSEDAGVSWSDNVALSIPFNHFLGYPNQNKLGDYYDMVSDDLGANLAYAATFNGEQDVYFLRIGTFDCNANGIHDEWDIATGTSEDCDTNQVPDECEPNADCNENGVQDICDIAAGSSVDCQPNRIPDECELPLGDCNANSIPDDCDIAAGTSADCQPNAIPDGCEPDCDADGIPDDCEIAAGTSEDCTANGVPDDCEPDCDSNGFADSCDIRTRRSQDCNGNGIPDNCDIDSGFSTDLDEDGIPDACDFEACDYLWDGFQSPDFPPYAGVHGIDSDGDGSAWDNPSGSAVIRSPGCEVGGSSDYLVRVTAPPSDPQEAYLTSEYVGLSPGMLDCGAAVYALSFSLRIDVSASSMYDWQFFIHDGWSGEVVAQLQFASQIGTDNQPGYVPGHILVNVGDPLYPEYADTGVSIELGICYDLEVVLDNMRSDDQAVEVYVNGDLKVTTHRLQANTFGIHYFRTQPTQSAPSGGTLTRLSVDAFNLCRTGASLMTWPDCNSNCVDDFWDITSGVSSDCDGNGVPDACEPYADCNGNGVQDLCDLAAGTSLDCNSNGIPDDCDVAAEDCNQNGIPDDCDISAGTSEDCTDNGVPDDCEPDCNANEVADSCDIAGATSADCNNNGTPDECETALRDCNDNDTPDDCDITAGTSDDCAGNGVPDECEPDCNSNGVADECDIDSGTSTDHDGDGVPDECQPDCNNNGTPDVFDIDSGQSTDCNANGIPDECDITGGSSADCQPDGIPDECQLELHFQYSEAEDDCTDAESVCTDITYSDTSFGATSDGCDWLYGCDCPDVWYKYAPSNDGIVTVSLCDSAYDTMLAVYGDGCPGTVNNLIAMNDDFCGAQSLLTVPVVTGEEYWIRIFGFNCTTGDFLLTLDGPECVPGVGDCNTNGIPDDCDLAAGTSENCNSNSVPDECEPDEDCNNNSVRDICDIGGGTSADCNDNLTPDECELAGGLGVDCNGNRVLDECDMAVGTSEDCNANDVPDECDIDGGTSWDCNTNGAPDECDIHGPGEGFKELSSWAVYDAGDHGVGDDPDGYFGAVFDGRYVYFVPYVNGLEAHGEVLRYDTLAEFSDASSWSAFDAGAQGVGYGGAVFDGRYVYFVPYQNNTASHGEVLRYDTTGEFEDIESWAAYDPGDHGVGNYADGYLGAAFDGRFVYFAPNFNDFGPHGEVLRYDTSGGFSDVSSWVTYDAGMHGVGNHPNGYLGAIFDGRYVYFVPLADTNFHGEVLRYDTSSDFSDVSSWAAYDAGAHGVGSDPDGYIDAVFDGRYVYFAPYHNGADFHGEVLRYDTDGGFSDAGSWAAYDPGADGVGVTPDGYAGAVYDGRFVYFVPFANAAGQHGEVMRYDTAGGFSDVSSWATYDPGAHGVAQGADGYFGAVFDGRHVYFAPAVNNYDWHGEVLRYDTTPPDWSLDCNENTIPDECDIAAGTSADVDSNGIPDECEEPADCPYIYDLDGSCFVDATDLGLFAPCWLLSEGDGGWDESDCADKDFDCSDTVDGVDLGLFASAWLKWHYEIDPADYPDCRFCAGEIVCPTPGVLRRPSGGAPDGAGDVDRFVTLQPSAVLVSGSDGSWPVAT